MNEFIIAALFIVLGYCGAYAHYFKKFYIDKTTQCTLGQYLKGNLPSTLYAAGTILFAEISLAATTTAISMAAIVGALTAGYTADSAIDRAPDSVQVGFDKAVEAVKKDV
jgi:hypothetical protein